MINNKIAKKDRKDVVETDIVIFSIDEEINGDESSNQHKSSDQYVSSKKSKKKNKIRKQLRQQIDIVVN